MSLRLDFTFLDKNGHFLYNATIGSANYTDDLQSLNFLHKVLKEHLTHPMMIHRKEIKYAVPDDVKSYMFDTDTFELLPNRFEKKDSWKKDIARYGGYSRVGHNNV
jgi:hypothetical protein